MAKPKKRIIATVRLILPGGSANPGPPIGPMLGQHGVNLVLFCQEFNRQTESFKGQVVRAFAYIFEDRTFEIEVKGLVTSYLLKQAAGIVKGSGVPNKDIVATIKRSQLEEIAKTKMDQLNADTLEAAVRTLEGQCRSMGIRVVPD